jgi:glycerophosphoryl diester phosphodiesterase
LRRLRTPAGERVPLLAEVLDVVVGSGIINVEVKEAGIADEVVTALDAYYLRRPADQADVLLSSFDRATTAALAKRRGAMQLGLLYDGESFDAALTRAVGHAARSLHLPLADVNRARIAAVQAQGLEAYVYTVNALPDIAHCHACGVDGVFSDYPDRVIAFLRARNLRPT